MKVCVEDLLTCDRTIGEEEVHAFAAQHRATEGNRRTLANLEDVRPVLRIEIGEVWRVRARNDEHVAEIRPAGCP